jgi:hypothetical protein
MSDVPIRRRSRPSPEQLWLDLQEFFARDKENFDPTEASVRAAWEAERGAAAGA